MLIKIVFELTRFFKHQNVVKIEFISIHGNKGGLYPGGLITGCTFFCLRVDRPVIGGGGEGGL